MSPTMALLLAALQLTDPTSEPVGSGDCSVNYKPNSDIIPTLVSNPENANENIGKYVLVNATVTNTDRSFAYADISSTEPVRCGRRHRSSGGTRRHSTYHYRYHGGRHRGAKERDYAEDDRGYDTPICHYEPSTPEVPRAAVVIPSITQCGTRTISGTVAFPHLSCGAFLIGDKVSVIGWLRRHESGNNQFVLERVAFVKLERNGQVLFNN
jgi:hypothetical protein